MSQSLTTWQPELSIGSNCPSDFHLSATVWMIFLHFARAESSTTNRTCHQLVTVELSPVAPGAVAFIHNSGAAYEVEFVDGDRQTIAIVTLESFTIRPLAGGELLHARKRE